MRKKAQAAMEFLITYGWAILVVIIAIAALAFFGVLDTDKFVSARCDLPPGLTCVDHSIDGNTVALAIVNNMGDTLRNFSIVIYGDSYTYYIQDLKTDGDAVKIGIGPGIPGLNPPFIIDNWKNGEQISIFLNPYEGGGNPGEMLANYTKKVSGLTLKSSGAIVGNVKKQLN